MAQKPSQEIDKMPPPKSSEEKYLDLWEKNIRLIAANGPYQKPKKNDG